MTYKEFCAEVWDMLDNHKFKISEEDYIQIIEDYNKKKTIEKARRDPNSGSALILIEGPTKGETMGTRFLGVEIIRGEKQVIVYSNDQEV